MNTRTLLITTDGDQIELRYSSGGGLMIEVAGGAVGSATYEITDPLDVLAISGFAAHVHGLMKPRGIFGIGER